MTLSKLIKELTDLQREVGDIEVTGVDEESETFCNISMGVVEDESSEALFVTVSCDNSEPSEDVATNNKGSLQ